MKIPSPLLLLTISSILHAGEPDLISAQPEPWITPTLDIRARYEFGEVDGFDTSHAFTLRERIGLKTRAWNGFSALVEGEFLQALVDDYHAGAPGADPFDPANTLIPDPETNELNQAYLQYDGYDTVFRLGRQKIAYDNHAFVSNGNWRQNWQTYDAFSITNKAVTGLTLNYAYVSQVNRLFGSNADAPLVAGPPPFDNVQDVASDVHLFNASYAPRDDIKLGAYAYLMDFPDKRNWNNNTFGGSVQGESLGLKLYGETAWQDKAGFNANNNALYAHATVTKPFGSQSVTLGIEHLGAGFKMPLSTPHPFNGYADDFAFGRIEGTHNGVTDLYLSHTSPLPWGITWTNMLHALGDNEISTGYGWEYDSVLSKKIDNHWSVIAKFAHFESEGDPYIGVAALPDATRFSLEVNFVY
jgi:hypothetical protein